MEPLLLTSGVAFLLWLLRNKGAGNTAGKVQILQTTNDGGRVKYRLSVGSVFIESWIFAADNIQIYDKGGYLFSAEYLPSKDGISFFIYQKGNPDKLVFSSAYTIGSAAIGKTLIA
jgi:hypothetical protein